MNWLLLRGLGRERRHWLGFDDLLGEKTGGRTLCLDLPGFGAESKARPPLSIEKTTDYLRQNFLKQASPDEGWNILGTSLGGMVSMDWLKRYPQDFTRGVLINPSARDLSPLTQRLSAFAIYCVVRAAAAQNPLASEKQILKMISNLAVNNEELVVKMHELRKQGLSGMNIARQLYAASRYISPSRIEKEILILASIKDRMVDVRCSKSLAEKLSAPIKYHPHAGHDLTLDDPKWVAGHIEQFIAGKL